MKLSLQNFSSLVQGMAAAAQSASRTSLDLTVGSAFRAILEANASIGLWMQWLILQVLQMTRAASSTGEDLDSWMADFSLHRLAPTVATGTARFSRLTPTLAAFVPQGAEVRTSDSAQRFLVTPDPANTYWNAQQDGYVIPAGTAWADLPVAAQLAGTAGNVQAGTVTMLATALPGIDSVTNLVPFMNGMDPESDFALRARFQAYLSSRSRATRTAVGYAVTSLQQNLTYAIEENIDVSGNARLGNFVVTIDDGSGSPSQQLLSAAYMAIDAVRPLATTFSVRSPAITRVTVSLALGLANGVDRNAAIAKLVSSVTGFINALPIGAPLPITRIAQLAYDVDSGVMKVSRILLNGSTEDIVPPAAGIVKSAEIVVN